MTYIIYVRTSFYDSMNRNPNLTIIFMNNCITTLEANSIYMIIQITYQKRSAEQFGSSELSVFFFFTVCIRSR